MENRNGNTHAHTPTTQMVVSNSKNNDTNIESIEHFRIKHRISVEHYSMLHTLDSTTTEHIVSSMNSRIIFAVATTKSEHRTCMYGWYCDHVRHQILLLWTLFFAIEQNLFLTVSCTTDLSHVLCAYAYERVGERVSDWVAAALNVFARLCGVDMMYFRSVSVCAQVIFWKIS